MTSSKCEAEIRPYDGRPTVFIDGEPHPLPGFNPNPRGTARIIERAADYFFQHKLGVSDGPVYAFSAYFLESAASE